MSLFHPEENTAICMYGPPEYFTDPAENEGGFEPIEAENETFFGKIVAAFRKLIDYIKGLLHLS